MTIEARIRDFRGAERVDLKVDPVCLLAGRNGEGKTSALQAVAAALTGMALPLALAKKEAGALVRVGAGNGAVEIRTERGSARVVWPDCSVSADGEPPTASRVAAGLDSLLDFPPEGRTRALAGILKTEPMREDLAAALADKGLGDETIVAPVWKLLSEQGWDPAHQIRRDKGAELKGRWRQVTGQNYGSRVAAAWTPPHWTDDLDGQSERELDAALSDAKAAHKSAIASAAADGARRKLREEEAGKLGERVRAVDAATEALTSAEAEVTRLRAERDALPATSGRELPTSPCPHCGAPIIATNTLVGVALQKPPAAMAPESAADLKRARLARAEADGKLSNAETNAAAAKRELNQAQAVLEQCRNARAELQKLPAPGADSVRDAAHAEAAVTAAERRLAAFRARAEADSIRDRIGSNELVIEILAADGLRARKLSKVLNLFNTGQLAPLCEAAGWKPVVVTPDMAVTYGGRDYRLLSASEQYRVRIILQVATARLDGSGMVVIDAADVLDAPTRNGLFRMLVSAEIPALVALTLSKREQVPDLAAAGLGQSVWMEAGVAEPLGQAARREAA